jgi:hypothetical protein
MQTYYFICARHSDKNVTAVLFCLPYCASRRAHGNNRNANKRKTGYYVAIDLKEITNYIVRVLRIQCFKNADWTA